MNLIKNKKYFLSVFIIFLVLFISAGCSKFHSNNEYYLEAEEKAEINIKGNSDNLDSYVTFEIASESENGR